MSKTNAELTKENKRLRAENKSLQADVTFFGDTLGHLRAAMVLVGVAAVLGVKNDDYVAGRLPEITIPVPVD